jgi:hypothetical protein
MGNSIFVTNGAQGKFPTIKPNSTLGIILQSIYDSYSPFLTALSNHPNKNLSNEKALVQEFVTQNDIQLRKHINALRIEKEYTDNFYGTRGIPDFAYLPLEEGVSHEPLFIVEAKILPAPDNITIREKEYVIGNNKNGGIERFKIGKHGIGVNFCGLIGFIKDDQATNDWIQKINSWIIEKCNNEPLFWSSDETLQEAPNSKDIVSLVKRESDSIVLYHFFVSFIEEKKRINN